MLECAAPCTAWHAPAVFRWPIPHSLMLWLPSPATSVAQQGIPSANKTQCTMRCRSAHLRGWHRYAVAGVRCQQSPCSNHKHDTELHYYVQVALLCSQCSPALLAPLCCGRHHLLPQWLLKILPSNIRPALAVEIAHLCGWHLNAVAGVTSRLNGCQRLSSSSLTQRLLRACVKCIRLALG